MFKMYTASHSVLWRNSLNSKKRGEAHEANGLSYPFPNDLPNEASPTSGESYLPAVIPILFILKSTSIFISRFLRNLDKAIASLPLGPHC